MTFLHRSIIDTIPSYKQGKPAPASADTMLTPYKISSNENPCNPLPSVREAVAKAALKLNRYPDMRGTAVVERLAQRYQVNPEQVVLGCGSTEVITMLVQLVAGPGDEVIYPWRSFEAYPIIVSGAGATSVQVPNLPDGSHDIEGMLAAINEHTRLIILNNPNNPTSTSLSAAQARQVMERVPSNVLVLFDEAYFQFNTDPAASRAMDMFRQYPNVVVAHTFSKAYGLAGLRIGYAIAPEEVVDGMRKVSLPFGVTDLAQQAALASLDAQDELDGRVAEIIKERDRVIAGLRELGWQVAEPYANFFWLAFGNDTPKAQEFFVESLLSVRIFDGEGIRISIGEQEANSRVLEVCKKLNSLGIKPKLG